MVKVLSGFYHVDTPRGELICRCRGRLRREGMSPVVGDQAKVTVLNDGTGRLDSVAPRKNLFRRPPVANVDTLVVIVSAVNPVADTFIVDQVSVLAALKGVRTVLCINKSDLDPGEELRSIYSRAMMPVINTSAETGQGIDELLELLGDGICAFTGNSGVGKSSILNLIDPDLSITTGQVSERLGRGRHTTRHTQLYRLPTGALAADTPGFYAFDIESMEYVAKERLQHAFPEFAPHILKCRYTGCSHTVEKGCAVLEAMERGEVSASRHASYVMMYHRAAEINRWDRKGQE